MRSLKAMQSDVVSAPENVIAFRGATGPSSNTAYMLGSTGSDPKYVLGRSQGPTGPVGPPRSERRRLKMATERELTDAKLEAVEARMETRLVGIESKLDRLLDRVEVAVKAAGEAKEEATQARVAAGNTKWNILFTGFTVLALLLAMWAIWNQGMELVAGILSANSASGSPPQ